MTSRATHILDSVCVLLAKLSIPVKRLVDLDAMDLGASITVTVTMEQFAIQSVVIVHANLAG